MTSKFTETTEFNVFNPWRFSAMVVTPLRLITGWLFFSAFWRRVVLVPGKLDPNNSGYVGHKIVTFLPHALWIKPLIEYTVLHAGLLYVFLAIFTTIEALTGLAMMLGFATRLASIGITLLSWGILMGAGWLGSTCLDEWQIGVAGIGAGLLIFMTGAGPWSIDSWWQKRYQRLARRSIVRWLTSGAIEIEGKSMAKMAAIFTVVAFALTLYTNQVFQGGVWGKLHNDSKVPLIKFSQAHLDSQGDLKLTMYRTNGPDTYGSFLVEVKVTNSTGQVVEDIDAKQLASLSKKAISNKYINAVHTTPYGLMIPLGAQASVQFPSATPVNLRQGTYKAEFFDVSGVKWTVPVSVK